MNYARWCNAVEDEFSDMDIYAVGTFSRDNPSLGSMAITKLSKNGQVLWQQRYSQSDTLNTVAVDIAFDQKYIYITGGALVSIKKSTGFVVIYDKQSGQLAYNLIIAPPNTHEIGNKILPIPGGFVYRSQRGLQETVMARYRLPTVSTTEAKLNNNINLYPNPTTRHLTIENIDKAQFNTAELWDSSGRLLLSSPVTDTTLHWQPEVLPPGTYQVVFHGPGGRLAKPLVVMRDER
jgi:hypothetical protein